ncbi:MAG: hotdog domain-containing protein [Pseudomonadota bacterium]
MTEPEIGATHALRGTVDEGRTAQSLAQTGEQLPPVFGTPFMIADMERACAALLAPHLAPGKVSVGARIEVSHLAPTALGETVTATARFQGRAGPLYWFEVWAEDGNGRIGEGRIARAVVDQVALLAKARARN